MRGRKGLKTKSPNCRDSALLRSTSAIPAPSPTIRQAVTDELASIAISGAAMPACRHCWSMAWPRRVPAPSEITDSPARSLACTWLSAARAWARGSTQAISDVSSSSASTPASSTGP